MMTRERGARARSRSVRIDNAGPPRRSVTLNFLDNQTDPELAFGSMVIVENEERLLRQEALDGMLEGDDEKFDKRVCW